MESVHRSDPIWNMGDKKGRVIHFSVFNTGVNNNVRMDSLNFYIYLKRVWYKRIQQNHYTSWFFPVLTWRHQNTHCQSCRTGSKIWADTAAGWRARSAGVIHKCGHYSTRLRAMCLQGQRKIHIYIYINRNIKNTYKSGGVFVSAGVYIGRSTIGNKTCVYLCQM